MGHEQKGHTGAAPKTEPESAPAAFACALALGEFLEVFLLAAAPARPLYLEDLRGLLRKRRSEGPGFCFARCTFLILPASALWNFQVDESSSLTSNSPPPPQNPRDEAPRRASPPFCAIGRMATGTFDSGAGAAILPGFAWRPEAPESQLGWQMSRPLMAASWFL